MNDNFTTIRQSKRLLALGLPANSADMFWAASDGNYPSTELMWNLYVRKGDSLDNSFFEIYNMNEFQVIPCWSVGQLVKIFLKCSPYRDIALNKNELAEQMVISFFMEHKKGLLDFCKLNLCEENSK